jgi:hypothetical protein
MRPSFRSILCGVISWADAMSPETIISKGGQD